MDVGLNSVYKTVQDTKVDLELKLVSMYPCAHS